MESLSTPFIFLPPQQVHKWETVRGFKFAKQSVNFLFHLILFSKKGPVKRKYRTPPNHSLFLQLPKWNARPCLSFGTLLHASGILSCRVNGRIEGKHCGAFFRLFVLEHSWIKKHCLHWEEALGAIHRTAINGQRIVCKRRLGW